MAISAEEALASLPGHHQQWSIPRLSTMVQKFAEDNRVYIYNVGPQMWIRYQGGLGTFVIRGCEPGKRYSDPVVIDGIKTETQAVDAGVMTLNQYDGIAVAMDILGKGAFREPSDDLTRYGVFISRSNPPAEDDLIAAEQAFADHDFLLIGEANRLFEVNAGIDAKTGLSNIQKHHYDAAKRQGQNPPWSPMSRRNNSVIECPACGENVKPSAARCNHCLAMLDEAKCRQYHPEMFAHEEPTRRGPGRPPKTEK